MVKLNNLDPKEWVKHTISWFTLNYSARDDKVKQHPATYPWELPKRYIEMFTRIGEWVLDPFCGTGSTLYACQKLGRNGVGLELQKKFVDIANKRIPRGISKTKQLIYQYNSRNVDSCNYIKEQQFSLIMTSPPYWDILQHSRGGSYSSHKERIKKGLPTQYSNDNNDLGNVSDYMEYIVKLASIFNKCSFFLKDNGYLVIVIQNLYGKDGEVYPAAFDLLMILRGDKYRLRHEQIWCQTNRKACIWGYPSTYVSNTHHHYCLILQKRSDKL